MAIGPEGRHVFPNLSVRVNLVAFADSRDGLRDVWDVERIYGVFPRLKERQHHLGSQLSGGEQQRISIARGLVNRPPVILADEPTAPLDSVRALAVIRILNDMAQQFQTAVIVVTHDEKIIPTFQRIYHIRDGIPHEEAGEGRSFV